MATGTLQFNVSEPPDNPALHSSKQKLKNVLQPSYWAKLCPKLHCADKQFMARWPEIDLGKERTTDIAEQINYAGVAQVSTDELPWSIQPEVLAEAVVTLMRYGWPPSMLLVYDEVWAIIQQASKLMRESTGGNACNMDILAWYVDPNRGDVGFSPHRDRQPDDSPATFRSDGSAMYATLWLPLTDAAPENSCLYVIPRFADPGYYAGDPDDDASPDPLTAALPDKAAYQHIRALPCKAGAACIFTHRTIHWGSKGRPGYPTPRISMSWGCADDAYESAYFSRDHLPCPPLKLRLALVGAQMIVYHERFPAPPKQLALYYHAFTAQAEKFDATYRAKVMREFVDASKEATAAAAPAPAITGNSVIAAAAAAANGTGDSSPAAGTAKKKRKGNKAAAAGVTDAEQQQQHNGSQKRSENSSVGMTAEPQQQGEQLQQQKDKKNPKQSTKKQKQEDGARAAAAAVSAPAAAAAAAAAAAESSDDEGDGINWAAVAKAARAAARKEKRKGKKKKGKASKGIDSDSLEMGVDADSDGDVMDMALDAVLDAQLAGQDFHDDFEDD